MAASDSAESSKVFALVTELDWAQAQTNLDMFASASDVWIKYRCDGCEFGLKDMAL